MSRSSLTLLGTLLLTACAPVRYVLPSPTLEGGGAFPSPWGAAEIVVQQLTSSNLGEHPDFAIRVIHEPSGRERFIQRVPLPSFDLQITNGDSRPLRLDGVGAWLSDGAGQRYELLLDRNEIARRALDQAIQAQPELGTVGWMQPDLDASGVSSPIDVLRRASSSLPLLGEEIVIQPGQGWRGAIVIAADAEHLEQLRRTVESGRVVLHVEGARAGDQSLPPLALAFAATIERQRTVRCADGREVSHPDACGTQNILTPIPNGTCVQEGISYSRRRHARAAFIGGQRVLSTEISAALLNRPESRAKEKRSMALKTAGLVLLGTGALAAVSTTAGLRFSERPSIAPAGLSLLGLSVVGFGLVVAGQRDHQAAVREYNAFAFESGLCARPR